MAALDRVYLYDGLGHLTDATSPGVMGSGVHATFVWRLDGLLANRGYSTGATTLVYAYDGAKRAIAECNGSGGACSGATVDIERTYDRVGDVMSETQTISGAHDDTNGTQSFTYDALRRVKTSSLGSISKAYTYDADSNRLTVSFGGVVTDTFSFDATDQTIADNTTSFTYDSYGNLTRSGTSSVTSTTYAYDLADRLSSITQADGSVVGFSFDAAGRHATRTGTGGTTIDTYGYLGTSDSVIRDVSSSGAGYTLVSAIDSAGDRLASSQGSGYAWVIADLHGNVAAQCSSGTITDVFRYDAYGKTIGTSLLGTIASPWRYQGRILESTPASSGTNAEVYDAGARAYVPDLGTFTSLDSVSGSAQNPLSLNRYLYANANPETLVDPSGHGSMSDDIYDYQHPLQNTTDMSTSVYNYQHPFIGSGDMSTDIYNYQHPRGSGGGAPPTVGDAGEHRSPKTSLAERGDRSSAGSAGDAFVIPAALVLAMRARLGQGASSSDIAAAIKEDLAASGVTVDHVVEVSVGDTSVYATEGGGGPIAGMNPRSLGHAENVGVYDLQQRGVTGKVLKITVDGEGLCWNCYTSLRADGAAVGATTVEVETEAGTTVSVDVATGARIATPPGARVYYGGPSTIGGAPAGPGGGPGFQGGFRLGEWGGPTGGGIHDEEE